MSDTPPATASANDTRTTATEMLADSGQAIALCEEVLAQMRGVQAALLSRDERAAYTLMRRGKRLTARLARTLAVTLTPT